VDTRNLRLLTPRDVGRRLHLSASRVIQLNREGLLPALRDSGGRRLFDAEVVEEFARVREAREAAAMNAAVNATLMGQAR
jgi:DNA-binding transcriptional MerR regulator